MGVDLEVTKSVICNVETKVELIRCLLSLLSDEFGKPEALKSRADNSESTHYFRYNGCANTLVHQWSVCSKGILYYYKTYQIRQFSSIPTFIFPSSFTPCSPPMWQE